MKLSVAMATYNGERFLREQLGSLAAQARLPDELVVCDDRSNDGTVSMLEEFRASAAFPVIIVRNAENLGIIGNFERAVSESTGDIIFLCDHDDIWEPNKLAAHERVYLDDSAVSMVFSNGEVVDSDLRSTGMTLWDFTGITPKRRRQIAAGRAFDLLIKRSACVGCTISFRAELRPILLPLSRAELHDSWIACLSSALGGVRALPDSLIKYRLHTSQSVGIRDNPAVICDNETARLADLDAQLARTEAVAERLEAFPDRVCLPDFRDVIGGKLRHLRVRRHLPRRRLTRVPRVMAEFATGRYYRFGRSLKADLKVDLAL